MNDDIAIAEVIDSGNIKQYDDEYYGYYDMYVARELEIVRILSRLEIVDMFGSMPGYRTVRFIRRFKLIDEEKIWMQFKHFADQDVVKAIAYYQDSNKNAYS